MLVDVKIPTKKEGEYVVAYQNGQWNLVQKSAYLEPYMKRNEQTELRFEALKKDFEALRSDFEGLLRKYVDLVHSVDVAKKGINDRLKEYHDVLRVLTNE